MIETLSEEELDRLTCAAGGLSLPDAMLCFRLIRLARAQARASSPAPPGEGETCKHDGKPCYVGKGTDDAHWRCGTSACAPTPLEYAAQGDEIAICRCGSFPNLYSGNARPDDGYRSLWCQGCMKHVTPMLPSAREAIATWNAEREAEHAPPHPRGGTSRLFINPGEDPAKYDALVRAHGLVNDLLLAMEAGTISREAVLENFAVNGRGGTPYGEGEVEALAAVLWNSDRAADAEDGNDDNGPWPPTAGDYSWGEDDSEMRREQFRRYARLALSAPPTLDGEGNQGVSQCTSVSAAAEASCPAGVEPSAALKRFCHACRSIPTHGYCNLPGCPTGYLQAPTPQEQR